MFRRSHKRFQFGACARALAVSLCALTVGVAPVRAQSASDPIYVFHTNLGDLKVQLYSDITPKTVANFLTYVNSGAYNNSLIHRSVPGFIWQGGGYVLRNGNIQAITANAAVLNEPHISNTRGTIAMAKQSGNPNSATDEWFFNEADSNASNLDNQNGGFTVFGKVFDSPSLAVMDRIAAVPVPSPPPFSAPLDQMPILNYTSGSSVTADQLVTVSSITRAFTWTGVDLAAGNDGGLSLLWEHFDNQAAVWGLTGANSFQKHAEFGPAAGYTALRTAVGSDHKVHILWTKMDGSISLWTLNPDNSLANHAEYGPYAGYTATDLAVGSDNLVHILWDKSDGSISLWTLSSVNAWLNQHGEFGPYAGYTGGRIAIGGNGRVHLLWNKADASISLWTLSSANAWLNQHADYGPFTGYHARGIAAGPDNLVHLLWTKSDNSISLWILGVNNEWLNRHADFGPAAGYTGQSIAVGGDAKIHILWDKTDGSISLWTLTPGFSLTSHAEFQPN